MRTRPACCPARCARPCCGRSTSAATATVRAIEVAAGPGAQHARSSTTRRCRPRCDAGTAAGPDRRCCPRSARRCCARPARGTRSTSTCPSRSSTADGAGGWSLDAAQRYRRSSATTPRSRCSPGMCAATLMLAGRRRHPAHGAAAGRAGGARAAARGARAGHRVAGRRAARATCSTASIAANPRRVAFIEHAVTLLRGAAYTAFDGRRPRSRCTAGMGAPYAHVTAPLRRLVDRYASEVCLAVHAGTPVPEWVRAALPGAAGRDAAGRPARPRGRPRGGRRHRGLAAARSSRRDVPGRGHRRRRPRRHDHARRAGRAGALRRQRPAGRRAHRGAAGHRRRRHAHACASNASPTSGNDARPEAAVDDGHGPPGQHHPVAAHLDPDPATAGRQLLAGQAGAPEALRPVRRERAVRRAGHRVLVDADARTAKKRETKSWSAPGAAARGDDRRPGSRSRRAARSRARGRRPPAASSSTAMTSMPLPRTSCGVRPERRSRAAGERGSGSAAGPGSRAR